MKTFLFQRLYGRIEFIGSGVFGYAIAQDQFMSAITIFLCTSILAGIYQDPISK